MYIYMVYYIYSIIYERYNSLFLHLNQAIDSSIYDVQLNTFVIVSKKLTPPPPPPVSF